MLHDSFRTALEQRLKESNMSGLALAEATGVSQSIISKFLRGARESIRLSDAIKITDYFGTSIEEIVSGASHNSPQSELAAKAKLLTDTEASMLLHQVAGILAARHPAKQQD